MIFSDVQEIEKEAILPVPIATATLLADGSLCINNLVPIPINKVNASYDRTKVLDLNFSGIVEGYVVFLKELGPIDITSMSEFQFIAFLLEAEYDDYFFSTYHFKQDFVIVKETFHSTYSTKYKDTAPVWGGFSHDVKFSEPSVKHVDSRHEITVCDELIELDQYTYENSVRAIEQPYAFERYLKMYHVLELHFDYHLIEKIKGVTLPAGANKIGQLLNDYSNSELRRLSDIIIDKCHDISAIEDKLQLVLPFKSIAQDMFISFGTNNAPLTNQEKFDTVLLEGDFTSSTFNKISVKPPNHPDYIRKLAAYWIYKVRCSIAHNKIGEYMLSWDQEDYIVEFAEPLLMEIIRQSMKK